MFARTERLLLRPGWVEDAPALAEAMTREVAMLKLAYPLRSSPFARPCSIVEAQSYLARENNASSANMLIFERTSAEPRLIGGIGLARDAGQTILDYWIVPSSWGMGFATEAGRAVIDLARGTLRIGQLTAKHLADNHASGRVLRKLGFRTTDESETLLKVENADAARAPGVSYTLDLSALALAA
jgi:RimJ/RimL family protein N-acetyltransferase